MKMCDYNVELLERVSEGTVEYNREIIEVIEHSYKDRESVNRITFPSAYLVRNSRLLNEVSTMLFLFHHLCNKLYVLQ